jgi:hypothetical protein
MRFPVVRLLEKIENRVFGGKIKYRMSIKGNKVYFGPVHAARQNFNPLRHHYMRELVSMTAARLKGEKLRILEVGSWAGQSALVWADAIERYYGRNGEIICVDPWMNYMDGSQKEGILKVMKESLVSNAIFDLFSHNVKASGYSDIIFSFRGFSNDRLPMLVPEMFHLVYIDGNHVYDAVRQDLQNGGRILKNEGIICGDDLELQYDEVDQEACVSGSSVDLITDPPSRQLYHPGVALAVWQFFSGRVSAREGFWAMQKRDDQWKTVGLNPEK